MDGARVTHRLGNDVVTRAPSARPMRSPVLLFDAQCLFLVPLGVANLALDLALDVLGLALDLLTRVAGDSAHRVTDSAFNLLCRALDLVFLPFLIEVV